MKQYSKIIAAFVGLAILVAAGIYHGAVRGADTNTEPEPILYQSKNTDEALGSAQNPFTVLEIVPDKSMAAFGYLIPGCEPVANLETDTTGAMERYKEIFAGANGIATVEDETVISFRGDFPENLGFDAATIASLTKDNSDCYFRQYGYFQHAEGDTGAYKYDAGSEKFLSVAVDDDANQITYHWVPLVNKIGDRENVIVDDIDAQMPENNADVTIEKEALGNTTDVVGSRYYLERSEETYVLYVKQKINHANALIQTLFPEQLAQEGFTSQVISVTPSQLTGANVENGIIQEADLIVIHDADVAVPIYAASQQKRVTPAGFENGNDLSAECFAAILKRQASGKPARMLLDESAMDESVTNAGKTRERLKIEKLYTVMNQYGAKYFYNVYFPDKNGLQERDPEENGAVYDLTVQNNGLCRAKYGFVLNWSGENKLFSEKWDDGLVSACTGLETDYRQQVEGDTMKKKLQVLELQPISSYIYGKEGWKEYYLSLFPSFIGTSPYIEDDIVVTTMPTYEFNGKIDDLNAAYDMILIGGAQDKTNGLNGYKDKKLGNLAYTTIGDLISDDRGAVYYDEEEKRKWQRWGNWKNGKLEGYLFETYHEIVSSTQGSDIAQCEIRENGTDVTHKKYLELLDFSMKSRIVVDEKLYRQEQDAWKVNTDFVDSSSFIYNLAKLGESGVTKEQKIENYADAAFSEDAAKSDSIVYPSCRMEFFDDGTGKGENGKPVEYEAIYGKKTVTWNNKKSKEIIDVLTGSTYNNQKNADGNNVLRYHFKLYGIENANYKVYLYLDSNGNGSFETNECNYEPSILDTTENAEGVAVANGTLQANRIYTVTKSLPPNETGILPWKLVVFDAQNGSVRDSSIGYTRLPSAGKKETIRVLQMNLSADMSNRNTTINFADKNSEVGAKFAACIGNVDDYDIDIVFQNNAWFKDKFSDNPDAWNDELLSYDMLILGFQDLATFTNDKTFLDGFKKFIAAGKSVIISHDMVSDKSFTYPTDNNKEGKWAIQEDISAYLRNLSGQIKKYYSNEEEKGAYSYAYSRGEQRSMLPRADLQIVHAWRRDSIFKNWFIDKSESADKYAYSVPGTGEKTGNLMDNSIRAKAFASDSPLTWPDDCSTNTVAIANRGQITNYPYKMGDDITVSKTHVQNYKLNLEPSETGGSLNFVIDGNYEDWSSIPHQESGHYTKDNRGALVYIADEKKAYGHVEVRDSNKNNPSSFRTFGITIRDADGKEIDFWTDPFTVDESGNITKGAQMSGLENDKSYTFYYGTVNRSINIHNLFKNSWGEDAVFGKIIVTPHADYVDIEYEIDVDEIVRYYNQWNGTSLDVNTVSVVTSNYSGLCAYGEEFTTSKTEGIVLQGGTTIPGDETVVWYNLSGGANGIFAARQGDSANNYYLYTKGNVTYTGLGHSGTMTNDEIKLFVNTMISSYRSQSAEPYLQVLNEDAVHNANVSTIYVTDREADTKDVTVQLFIGDDSIITNEALQKTYTLTITDEATKEAVVKDVSVNREEIYSLSVSAEDLGKSAKTYTAELKTTFTQEGKPVELTAHKTIRVMKMPLFTLN